MKIALVAPYDFAYPGGVANHVTSLEKQLTAFGHQVKIIAPTSRPISQFGSRFIHIGTPRPIPGSGSVARITLSVRLANKIKAVLAKEQFDVVHLHEPFMIMLCSAILRFSNTVNIGTFHSFEAKPGYNFAWPISRWMLNRRSKKLQGHIAVSKAAESFHSKFVKADYTIIPNGIDLSHFQPSVEPMYQYRDGKTNIVFVGRLEKRKGVNYLIDAFKRVHKEHPETRLLVVGPGTRLRPKYEKMVRRAHLEDSVVFTGGVSYADLPRYYQTADICCAPATGRESFGIVLLEAMALGKPLVVSNIPGYACVVNHEKEGLLVKPSSAHHLADGICRLIEDKALRDQLGRQGLVTVQEYSWEKVARRVEQYYRHVLAKLGKTPEDFPERIPELTSVSA
ncbi:glycosyltransferase family 4 protein [Dehalogenimonas etheniformans]|uniref:Glycosyltransferase family 1 protein n=1 Tax=Dehalogenimonas etheniformans TaxID=1536648 RepID=A0A2P5P8V4_9CHLR|nr:glycosyltransferase family 4 protein [Dehalogenimonas etheniformans]PPD58720.1 glycosyltransferase family 1 protein [Dehalogenimonas etheniformans]QNT76513.1 glycosyltransferase family 4 protein [Dehalogenimonas etheniformans]